MTEHFRGSRFKLFAGMIAKDPKVRVWAIPAPGGGSRAFCDRMNGWAVREGKKGLGYIFCRERAARRRTAGGQEGSQDPTKHTPMVAIPRGGGACRQEPRARGVGRLRSQPSLGVGDAAFFAAGDPAKFFKFAGEARDEIGTRAEAHRREPASRLPGSSTSRSTSGTRRRRRSTSPTTRSRCRRAGWRRWSGEVAPRNC